MKNLIYAAVMVIFLSSCSSKKYQVASDYEVRTEGVIAFSAGWVKDKGHKWDVGLNVESLTEDSGIIVYLSDMHCYRGKRRGVFKHTFFNTGERTIDFKPGELKRFNLVCDLDDRVDGDFRIVIKKVYENENLDGKTAGKILARDLSWNYSI